jgi:cytochrome P450
MVASFAAVHTTAMDITHAIYNLATYAEYQKPLRQELEKVLEADNGILIKSSMTRLKKMDSFIKES